MTNDGLEPKSIDSSAVHITTISMTVHEQIEHQEKHFLI
jgi:hypothetical protein